MAKKESKYKYLMLNEKADSFTDMHTLFSISGNQVAKVDAKLLKSKQTRDAIATGHLREASEDVFEKYTKDNASVLIQSKKDNSKDEKIQSLEEELVSLKEENENLQSRVEALETENEELKAGSDDEETDEVDFDDMNMDEIKAWLTTNRELTDEEIDSMEKFKRDELVDFANEKLEEEE